MIAAVEKAGWPNIPGVDEHIAFTGEQPPHHWAGTPADMLAHGGYAVVTARAVIGPYCWHENAERAALLRPGARVMRWRDAARLTGRIAQLPVGEKGCGRKASRL